MPRSALLIFVNRFQLCWSAWPRWWYNHRGSSRVPVPVREHWTPTGYASYRKRSRCTKFIGFLRTNLMLMQRDEICKDNNECSTGKNDNSTQVVLPFYLRFLNDIWNFKYASQGRDLPANVSNHFLGPKKRNLRSTFFWGENSENPFLAKVCKVQTSFIPKSVSCTRRIHYIWPGQIVATVPYLRNWVPNYPSCVKKSPKWKPEAGWEILHLMTAHQTELSVSSNPKSVSVKEIALLIYRYK